MAAISLAMFCLLTVITICHFVIVIIRLGCLIDKSAQFSLNDRRKFQGITKTVTFICCSLALHYLHRLFLVNIASQNLRISLYLLKPQILVCVWFCLFYLLCSFFCNILVYRINFPQCNLLKTWFLFLVCRKGQKEDKSEFLTKSVGIIVTIIFMQKCISNCQ